MALPSIILDGVMPYGTTPITINGVTYIVDDNSLTPNWTTAEDQTSSGGPGRARYTKGRWEGTMTLQLATGATAYPPSGATFTYPVPNEGNLTFVVLNVPYTSNNQPSNIRTCTITARQVIYAITTVA